MLLLALIPIFYGCQSAQEAKELKMLGYTDDMSKGTSVGMIEGGDCVFQVFGYWLGGRPTLSRAIINARSGKSTGITDAFGTATASTSEVRYLNNVSVRHEGFNAVVFGKQCINVSATGYK